MQPLERTEDEGELHRSGRPWSTDEQQRDQNYRPYYSDCVAIPHEVSAKYNEAEKDRDVD